jgi:hypothetical protein
VKTSKKTSATLFVVFIVTSLLLLSLSQSIASVEAGLSPDKARAIGKEAYIYGNPIVDNYRIMYAYFVDQKNPEFKAPWNQLKNYARVFTSKDRAIQTPNSDTPYSFIGMDLRTEPLVMTVPPIEKSRYYSIQLIDIYTHIFGYIGSRATGNKGGNFLIAGPGWQGNTPAGITKVIRSETELALAFYRTQLFNPEDIEKVKKVQAGYKVQPLSAFLGQPAPKAAPAIDFIKPLTPDELKKSPAVFNQLNFVLQFCPPHASEKKLMVRFAKIGITAGKTVDAAKASPEVQKAIGQGIGDAWADFMELKKRAEAGEITSADLFGSREQLQNNYLNRMGGAVLGIYGNVAEEATYPSYYVDADGQKLDGVHRYTLHFTKGQLPPVNSFWSMTMYDQPASLMVANPINRYLLNSPMLPEFKTDKDGGITFYIQHESPGSDKKANWLPAPKGLFSVNMRLYWPKKEALDGRWQEPKMQRVK